MGRSKVVQDSVHGSIPVDGIFMDVMDRHEVQRLRQVRQLGLSHLVFPGANHTRFEHSLGAYHLAGRMADSIGLDRVERDTVRMAGLLHDVCHPPFSHTLEHLMERATGLDHMELARGLIMGDVPDHLPRDDDILGGRPSLCELMEAEGISAGEVCDIISFPESRKGPLDPFTGSGSFFPSHDYLHQIIHGPVDADQMDYLMRDAHHTGVTHGSIEAERLINTMRLSNDRITITQGGATAAEGLMVSRSLMFTTVYFHETVRIAQRMLSKAVEESGIPLDDIYLKGDQELISEVIAAGGRPSATVRGLMGRRINKKALVVYSGDMDDPLRETLSGYVGPDGWARLEREVAEEADVDPYDICAETVPLSSMRGISRIGKTDVAIVDDGGHIRYLTRSSPLAKALQSRDPYGWTVLVSAPAGEREAVGRAARRVLGL